MPNHKPEAERRETLVAFRLNEKEKTLLDQLAEQSGRTPSEFFRDAILNQEPLLEANVMQNYNQWLDTQIQNMSVKDFKAYKKKLNNQK